LNDDLPQKYGAARVSTRKTFPHNRLHFLNFRA